MRSDVVVVAGVRLQNLAQMHLAQDNDVVHTLAPERSDQPFGKAVLPRRSWCDRLPYTEAITLFARAIGAARSGDAAAAEQDASDLGVRHQKLVDAGNTYWAREVEIQQRAVAGWIAFAHKNVDDALKLMREAAELEDKNEKHIVTPGRILPARELLGDMLYETGQPVLALKEYEASQQREPNRFRGYYGAARAAEAAGDRDKAAMYYGKLLTLAKSADTERPELARARAFVER